MVDDDALIARCLRTAHALGDAARAVSMPAFRRPQPLRFKADGSVVTRTDLRIETLWREQIAQRHPEHGIVGEEFAAHRPQAPWVWVLDPIDGTASFVSGIPLWGALIGPLDVPRLEERWSALRGEPARRRQHGRALPHERLHRVGPGRLSMPDPDGFTLRQRAFLRRIAQRVALHRYGGDCVNYGLLASGRLDLVVEAGLAPHDVLPLVPIVHAAGGVISDWTGNVADESRPCCCRREPRPACTGHCRAGVTAAAKAAYFCG
jgi:inositol-phosphate phosphatase/L-galactose 1-phosphate phosphatase/histidinol-phosphatase